MKRVLFAALALIALAAAAFAAIAWHPADRLPASPAPDPALVPRGAQLAALGDCATCHTAPAGRPNAGRPYAGGYRLETPFGAIYTPNITPDRATGIGNWSLAAFTRAMRDGVGRDGRNLYPALPYDHFTHLTGPDLAALYAFLMSAEPVPATAPPNELAFPFNWRPLLAGWDLLYLHPGPIQPGPAPGSAHDATWTRGRYLVDALGHCGACHTPRNALGAEQAGRYLAGGQAEGWSAWPLSGSGWSEDSLYTYLRTGQDGRHGGAAGPMAPVTWNLARVPDADVHAMAAYLATLSGPPHPAPHENPAAEADSRGATIFAGACNICHGPASVMHAAGAPYLTTSTTVAAADPGNALRAILRGIPPNPAHPGPQMPPFAATLTDGEVAAVAAYLRARYAPDQPPWTVLPDAARRIRNERGAS